MKTSHIAIATTALAALALAGCSGGTEKDSRPDGRKAAVQTARTYQQAVNSHDWKKACTLKTERARFGSLQQCVKDHTEESPEPEPSESSTAPEDQPSYADGSSVPPMANPTPSEGSTGEASLSPVRTGDVVKVPAVGKHPAGYGVEITFTYAHGDEAPSTERDALRVVKAGKSWRVDQNATIHDTDQGHGSPVRTALSRE